MKITGYILIFLGFACSNSKPSDSKELSIVPTQGTEIQFITRVALIDVTKHKELDVTPPLVFGNNQSILDSLALINYIKRRSATKRGNKQTIVLQFNVSNRYTISDLDRLINTSERVVCNNHPVFDGLLEIVVSYSSFSDSWLNIPSPPGMQ